jgi:uncharacterized protein involved in outer membrane biogenesis
MRWKWILGIAAAVIVGLFLTIYIIAASYDYNKFKPQITGLAKEYTGRELTLAGDIKLGIGLSPTLKVEDVAFQNVPWGSRPEMAKIERLEVQLEVIPLLSGEINLKRLTLLKPDILIEKDKSGKTNLEFEVPTKKEPEAETKKGEEGAPALFAFREISIKDGKVELRDHQSGKTEVLQLDRLDLEAPEFGAPADIVLKAIYNDIPIEASGRFGQLGGLLMPDEPWPVDLSVQAVKSKITLAGQIQDPLDAKGIDLKMSVEGKDLGNFQQITGEPLPVQGPFKVSGHLLATDLNSIEFKDFAIGLGKSRINGSVAVNLAAKKPEIRANFNSQTLDLRPVLAQEEKKTKGAKKKPAKAKKKQEKVFPDEPFELGGLHAVNASIDLQIAQLLLRKIALDDLKATINLKEGHLIVKPIRAKMGGGKLKSSLDLLAKGKQATMRIDVGIDKLDLGDMLKKLQITEALDGVLDVDINLKGRGHSVASLMAGLDGDVVAVLGEGEVPPVYLNIIGADLGSSFTKLVNPFGEKVKRAKFNCVVCDFNIKTGMANSDVIMVDDPRKTLLSFGQINLKTEQLDFRIETKPKEGIGTEKTGKFSLSLSELTKPFKLGGTLAKPSLDIDVTRTAKTVGTVLLGPAGIGYLMLSRSSGDETPCVAALKVAGRGTPESKAKSGKGKEQKGTAEKKKEGLGSKFKGIFGGKK